MEVIGQALVIRKIEQLTDGSCLRVELDNVLTGARKSAWLMNGLADSIPLYWTRDEARGGNPPRLDSFLMMRPGVPPGSDYYYMGASYPS